VIVTLVADCFVGITKNGCTSIALVKQRALHNAKRRNGRRKASWAFSLRNFHANVYAKNIFSG
jgi:hypothetical protein